MYKMEMEESVERFKMGSLGDDLDDDGCTRKKRKYPFTFFFFKI